MSPIDQLVRPAAGDPEGAIVLLHGRGADEHDLFGLFDVLDPERRAVGVTLGAPLRLPPGGRHWYVVPRVGFPDPDTFFATVALLDGTLNALAGQVGVPWERTVLGGFSQGAVMSYALGLGAGRPAPAGILAMSGFMATVPGFTHDLAAHRDLPVMITHGTLDPVIDVAFGHAARDAARDAGLDVTYRETPMPHTIDPRLIPEIAAWTRERLAPVSGRAG